MIPTPFQSKYPSLAAALVAMHSPAEVPREQAAQAAIKRELAEALQAAEPLALVANGLFDEAPKPDDEFMRFSLAAYGHLGVSDEVRLFMGRLWADVLGSWKATERAGFLQLMVKDRHQVFEALDFAVELFRRVDFAADEVLPWITTARQQVGNDFIQRGLWGCIQAYCTKSPTEAVKVADGWLTQSPDETALGAIANMIGWLRLVVGPAHPAAAAFAALEARVQGTGSAAWRKLYIESWARAAGDPSLTEAKALELRDKFVQPGGEAEAAWCFLLNAITQADRLAWAWTHREIKRLARPQLDDNAKYWAIVAVLLGMETSTTGEAVSPDDWRQLFNALLPLAATHVGTWQRVQDLLVTLAGKDPAAMRELIRMLARGSGASWLKIARQRTFNWLFNTVRANGLHAGVSADLCFQAGAKSRELGTLFFAECGVERLDPVIVAEATAVQLELLLLEAQRRLMDHQALARLHACLAERVDQLGGELAETFYDEVATQCLNTNGYRTALAAAAGNHEYLMAILKDADERLTTIHKAASSPALQMEVPGQARAEKLAHRRFSQEVEKGMEEHSVFARFATTVHLLYGGKKNRMFNPDGTLGGPSEMHASSTSVEMPRMDFMDPEGMHLRRLVASVRIAALEKGAEAEDDA